MGDKLAIEGGTPVRTAPLPEHWPGALLYDEEEVEAITRVIRAKSPFRDYGLDCLHEADKFEEEAAKFFGVKYALGVNSGTSALQCAMAALGIGPGQEVIVPGFMWVSTVAAVVLFGGIPVLAEIDETYNMDPEDLKRKITPRTTAVIVVHMRGSAANLPALMEVTREAGIKVIEDTSQACGSSIDGKLLGSWGDMGTFSLQYNKNMTTGEGGFFLTNEDLYAQRAKAWLDLGFQRDGAVLTAPPGYPVIWGSGSRFVETTAALARVQLRKLPKTVKMMCEHQQRVIGGIRDLPGITFRRLVDPESDSGYCVGLRMKDGKTADWFVQALRAEGVPCISGAEEGLHVYSAMKNLTEKRSISPDGYPWTHPANEPYVREYGKGSLPRTDELMEQWVAIWMPPTMTEEDDQDIIKAVRKVYAHLPGS
ncbi:MAG: DegT/DnrJ/EryC1/StrS family aminotransferase [Anaerolineae bacterium]